MHHDDIQDKNTHYENQYVKLRSLNVCFEKNFCRFQNLNWCWKFTWFFSYLNLISSLLLNRMSILHYHHFFWWLNFFRNFHFMMLHEISTHTDFFTHTLIIFLLKCKLRIGKKLLYWIICCNSKIATSVFFFCWNLITWWRVLIPLVAYFIKSLTIDLSFFIVDTLVSCNEIKLNDKKCSASNSYIAQLSLKCFVIY